MKHKPEELDWNLAVSMASIIGDGICIRHQESVRLHNLLMLAVDSREQDDIRKANKALREYREALRWGEI